MNTRRRITRYTLLGLPLLWLAGCTPGASDLASYVDPLTGSGAHGHVFVGANVPFGAVQLGPTNDRQGWDWCSGYHFSDTTVIGFGHTHLSGTGIGDKGDIHFMPLTGFRGLRAQEYLSTFTRANEVARAGYYKTRLDRYGVTVELTATERTGFHRYTFPATDSARVLVNLFQGVGWDSPRRLALRAVNDTTVEGYRFSSGWAVDDRVYFVAQFSKPFKSLNTYADTLYTRRTNARTGTEQVRAYPIAEAYGILDFGALDAGEQIEARVAISGVSVAGAQANLQAEALGKPFDTARLEARGAWNRLLGHVQVEGRDRERMKTFYTALYHTSFFPSVFNDVTGEYRGADGNTYDIADEDFDGGDFDDGGDRYTNFSLWDTYRAAHPLFTITAPEKVGDFVNSFIRIYQQQGKVPVWHLAGNETDCMVGFPSVMVVADAILKELPGFDIEKAYEAIKAYELLDERGLKQVRERGYIPADQEPEAVAKALEYCIADWSIAQVAKKLGREADYAHFLHRSQGYRRYFDPSDRFFKGVMADGSLRRPFNPDFAAHRANDYTEGNAWQYLWLVPHDFEGLFGLFPDPEAVEAKLDSTFSVPFDGGPDASPDISGLIGQYAQGNEPNHSTIFAYAYLGRQWKTARLARKIMDEFFFNGPQGLCGNEDMGQMSAWYVFNAIGFYPANPVGGAFVLGSPLFDRVTFPVGRGKTFEVVTENNSRENLYIQSAQLNGRSYTKAYILYKDIMAGGQLKLVMGPVPNEMFGADSADRPCSSAATFPPNDPVD